MSVTPNFCCDETKNRGAYTRVTDLYGTFQRGASPSAFSGWRFPACGQRDLSQPTITFECRGRKGQMGNQAEGPRLAVHSPPRQGKAAQPGPGPQALASLPEKVLLHPHQEKPGEDQLWF